MVDDATLTVCKKLDGSAVTQRLKQIFICNSGEIFKLEVITIVVATSHISKHDFAEIGNPVDFTKWFLNFQILKEIKPELVGTVVLHRTVGAMEPKKERVSLFQKKKLTKSFYCH